MQLCNYHQNHDTEYCHYSKNSFIPLCSESPLSTLSFWQWLFWSLMLQFCHLKGIIHIHRPIHFIWHLSLSMMLLRFIHIVMYISSFFIFITDYYFVMGIIYLLIHQVVDIWIVSSLGNIMKKNYNKDMCKSSYVDMCFHFSGVLRSGITESYSKYMFNFIRNCRTVFKVALPFYIFTKNIGELQLLCTLANIW